MLVSVNYNSHLTKPKFSVNIHFQGDRLNKGMLNNKLDSTFPAFYTIPTYENISLFVTTLSQYVMSDAICCPKVISMKWIINDKYQVLSSVDKTLLLQQDTATEKFTSVCQPVS